MTGRQHDFTRMVQEWGNMHRRDFAWRHTSDPYEILVAEILVQRTKAAQAENVYRSFVKKWPNPSSLCRAKPSEISRMIRSLGLNYRAKRLRGLSCEISRKFESRIPDDISKLRQLRGKGLGEYMAHAILSFAYGQKLPIVDKNVERILIRVFSLKVRKNGHRDPTLWNFAAKLVPIEQAKEYNWSLIDFGALVCTPKNPKCGTCPILDICDYGRERLGRLESA